jgi:hypothetical protein
MNEAVTNVAAKWTITCLAVMPGVEQPKYLSGLGTFDEVTRAVETRKPDEVAFAVLPPDVTSVSKIPCQVPDEKFRHKRIGGVESSIL